MQDHTNLVKLFRQYASSKNYHAAFNELLDFFLVPFKIHNTAADRQGALAEIVANPDVKIIAEILEEIGVLSEGFKDPLGSLYESLISKGQKGQFFTPEHVASLMASISVNEESEAGNTICDPACGSGRMLLAAARINRRLHFYGADIDPTCAKMTLVNFILNSLTGEVAHMDTLANDFHRGFKTATVLRGKYYHPYYIEFTNKEDSYLWTCAQYSGKKNGFDTPFNPMSSGPTQGIQGSLFEQGR
jgi:type I restriction-modification system DNA methylase subunit